jgi:acetyltransferase-like isoleucine patch superfamily enzyme
MEQKIKTIIKGNKFLYSIVRVIKKMKFQRTKPICGNNNIIINKGVINKIKYNIIGDNNTIEIMQGAYLSNTTIYMRGNNHKLIIRENCHFKGGEIWFEDHHCQIDFGRDTTVESAHIAVTEPNRRIIIGDDCMFSSNIEFRTGDSHSIIDNESRKRINLGQDILIGNHVWIGAHAIILKGVVVGNNSIIGTNSLVTGSIPHNCIAAGIPSKTIRNNIDWIRERIYED